MAELTLKIDREGREPLFRQIAGGLRAQIKEGLLKPDSKLPPVRRLARHLGVTSDTVAAAYKQLQQEGCAYGHVGRGTFVSPGGILTSLRYEREAGGPYPPEDDAPPFIARFGEERNTGNFFTAAGALARYVEPSPHAFLDETLKLGVPPGTISFTRSVADPALFPTNDFRRAVDYVIRRDGPAAFDASAPEGYYPLRNRIALMMADYGINVGADEVLVTSGCQQGIDLCVRVFVAPGDTVLVESPAYIGALESFRAAGARLIGVPVREDGLDVEMVAGLIREYRPKLIFTVPSYHNPTGVSMPPGARARLVELAAHYGLPIVEDGSSEAIYFGERPLAPLKSYDGADHVIYLGTFSKPLLPGLRVGYVVAGKVVLEKLTVAKYAADSHTNTLEQRAVARYLERELLPAQLTRVRGEYRRRAEALQEALAVELTDIATWTRPAGGFNVWLTLPPGISALDLYLEAVRAGVAFMPGAIFYPTRPATNTLRLCYSTLPPVEIERGIRILTELIRRRLHGAAPHHKLGNESPFAAFS